MIVIARCILLVAIALPLITWTVDRCVLRRTVGWPLMSLLTWLGCILIAWIAALVLEIGIEANMMSFDLNRDGSISGSELTPAAELAIDRWSSDVGRNFGVFLVIPLFAIWTAVVYSVLSATTYVVRSVRTPGSG